MLFHYKFYDTLLDYYQRNWCPQQLGKLLSFFSLLTYSIVIIVCLIHTSMYFVITLQLGMNAFPCYFHLRTFSVIAYRLNCSLLALLQLFTLFAPLHSDVILIWTYVHMYAKASLYTEAHHLTML
jgi:hypothetical protein